MAQLTPNAFESKFNDAAAGLFKTGQSFGIGSDDMRTLVKDIRDSFAALTDDVTFTVPVTQLIITDVGPPAETSWDWTGAYVNIGTLLATETEIEITFANQPVGGTGYLFVKKTISGDVTIVVPSADVVGSSSAATEYVLSGATNTIFRLDFFNTANSGFNLVHQTTQGEAWIKLIHLDADHAIGLYGNILYATDDGGAVWAELYESPEYAIIDFDIVGTDGCMLTAHAPTGSQQRFDIWETDDGGVTWTEVTTSGTIPIQGIGSDTGILFVAVDDYWVGHATVNSGSNQQLYHWLGSFNASGSVLVSGGLNDQSLQHKEFARSTTNHWFVSCHPSLYHSCVGRRTASNTWTIYAGSTWVGAPLSIFATSRLLSVAFASSTLGIAVGYTGVSTPVIIKSTDSGQTWTTETIDSAIGIIRKVRAVTATSFICVGDSGIGYSVDSGDTWTYYTTPISGIALSAYDADDILISSDPGRVWLGFGTALGNIVHQHISKHEANKGYGFIKEGTITTAQVLQLNGTPHVPVAAGGAGVIAMPIALTLTIDYAGTPYATNLDFQVRVGTTVITSTASFINVTADSGFTFLLPISQVYPANQNINFFVATGNPTAGTSDIKYRLVYYLIDVTA